MADQNRGDDRTQNPSREGKDTDSGLDRQIDRDAMSANDLDRARRRSQEDWKAQDIWRGRSHGEDLPTRRPGERESTERQGTGSQQGAQRDRSTSGDEADRDELADSRNRRSAENDTPDADRFSARGSQRPRDRSDRPRTNRLNRDQSRNERDS